MRVLLVEDSIDLANAIAEHFRRDGHAVDHAETVDDARFMLMSGDPDSYDIVLLDLMLPDGFGSSVLDWLRARGSSVAVLVLTARSQVTDRVSLLDLGADDYLTKPVDFSELNARCRAVLRRKQGKSNNLTKVGDLEFDASHATVYVRGEPVPLRSRELRLLEVMLASPGALHAKGSLLEKLFDLAEEPSENAIEVYIGRLRKKLEGSNISIETVRGVGYRLNTAPGPR